MAIIKEVGSRGKLHTEWNSPQEILRAITKLGWSPAQAMTSDGRDSGSFHSFSSLAEAIDVYKNSPEKVAMFDEKTEKLESPDAPGRDVEFDVVGDYLDIGRFLAGEPEDFGRVTMGNPSNAFCTINILDSFVYDTKPKYQAHKAKHVLRLVDWLENCGIRTQVVAAQDSAVNYNYTVVKQFQDPFDLNTLAIVLHPDWLRRIQFLIMEQSKTWQSGYGSAIDYDMRMSCYEPKPEDGLYVYVGGYMSNRNDTSALDEQFDAIYTELSSVVRDGLNWTEKPLIVKDID